MSKSDVKLEVVSPRPDHSTADSEPPTAKLSGLADVGRAAWHVLINDSRNSPPLLALLLVFGLFGLLIAWYNWMPTNEPLSKYATVSYAATLSERGIKELTYKGGSAYNRISVNDEFGSHDVCEGDYCARKVGLKFEISLEPAGHMQVRTDVDTEKHSLEDVRKDFDEAVREAIGEYEGYRRVADSWRKPDERGAGGPQ